MTPLQSTLKSPRCTISPAQVFAMSLKPKVLEKSSFKAKPEILPKNPPVLYFAFRTLFALLLTLSTLVKSKISLMLTMLKEVAPIISLS